MAKRIYRAANDDMVMQGMSFAECVDDARRYLDNPGFGGATLYAAEVPDDHRVLDLTECPFATLSAAIGREITPDMGGYMISQALQLVPGLIDEIAAAGYDWVRYVDDYPVDCVTLTACSEDAEDVELTEI